MRKLEERVPSAAFHLPKFSVCRYLCALDGLPFSQIGKMESAIRNPWHMLVGIGIRKTD